MLAFASRELGSVHGQLRTWIGCLYALGAQLPKSVSIPWASLCLLSADDRIGKRWPQRGWDGS